MNAMLFLDSLLTVLLSLALLGAGGLTLWLLPWTDADRDGTVRGMVSVARGVSRLRLLELAGRSRSSRVASSR